MAYRRKPKHSTFIRVGLPFIVLVCGGYYGLTKLVDGKVQSQDMRIKSQTQRQFNLEEEHEKMMRKLNTEDFELKAIPTPGTSTKPTKSS